MLRLFVAAVSVIALTACAAPDSGDGQSHRGQAGPYISGSAGVGF
ncbi:MAG TPA: hypothetical protein VH023_21685 [Rhodopila sp.]|jgi:hypothetical protein|nr:hypothetical protein [Rhodopila sp.]